MPTDLFRGEQAREDVLDIYVALAVDSAVAADKVLASIEARAAMLADYPRLGSRRNDIRRGLRTLLEGPYLILYELHPDRDEGPLDSAEKVRIVDGRRDLIALFQFSAM